MENIHNFRDFGGYRTGDGSVVKKGLLYRSGGLDQASENDLNELNSLGIRTVVDLRLAQERSQAPDRFPDHRDVQVVQLPMKRLVTPRSGYLDSFFSLLFGEARRLDFERVARQSYREYVTQYRDEISEILRLVSERRNLPVLIHCTAGKDRTGVVCSLLQRALGVPGELAMQDYMLSNECLNEYNRAMLKRLRFLPLLGVPKQKFIPLLEARKEYLQAIFDQIESEFGDLEEYFRDGLGFSEGERIRLKEILLEEEQNMPPIHPGECTNSSMEARWIGHANC
jgi:protein-tyrosine phosphatase